MFLKVMYRVTDAKPNTQVKLYTLPSGLLSRFEVWVTVTCCGFFLMQSWF